MDYGIEMRVPDPSRELWAPLMEDQWGLVYKRPTLEEVARLKAQMEAGNRTLRLRIVEVYAS